MRTELQASSQSCRSIGADAWCKWALKVYEQNASTWKFSPAAEVNQILIVIVYRMLFHSFVRLLVPSQRLEMIMKRVKTDTPDSSPKVNTFPVLIQ